MKEIILASQSPRRRQILESAGYHFQSVSLDIDESFPDDIAAEEIATYLANKKANSIDRGIFKDKIVITADTVVISSHHVMAKPAGKPEAQEMLQELSGKTHQVITAICILFNNEIITLQDATYVTFKKLSDWEIDHYIDHYQPFDKAGAYGIQEWIGMIGIEKIDGSYYNVVGLPIHLLHRELQRLLK